jgi:hypothetical protein
MRILPPEKPRAAAQRQANGKAMIRFGWLLLTSHPGTRRRASLLGPPRVSRVTFPRASPMLIPTDSEL